MGETPGGQVVSLIRRPATPTEAERLPVQCTGSSQYNVSSPPRSCQLM
jgi:hypothetical protein